jgi:deazaflavin-dependent oxidoreductase (nitroreductase family)
MGKRLLLLEHKGRRSGKIRRAVLEVIRYDPTVGVFYVVSGFGGGSDWIKNIVANPDVRIHIQGKSRPAIAAILNRERSAAEILDYAERNPKLIKVLAKSLLGYQLSDKKEDLLEVASNLQVVRFHILKEEGR